MALDFIAGCVGGAAGVLVGYPLDTVKVKIQTQDPSAKLQYRGTFHCLQEIIKQDGTRGLYKGMSSPLCGVAAINAITFGVYGNALKAFSNPDSIGSITMAGSTAGLIQTFVVSPMELVKTQMQVGGNGATVGGTVRHIWQQGGLRGCCRGLAITFTREVPAFGIYFGSYEIMMREMGESTLSILTAGGFAGIFSWIFTYPQDVIKSRLQADGFGAGQTYRGAIHCLKVSLAKEGSSFLTRGLGSSVIRAFPVNAATFYVYTFVMKILGEDSSVVQESIKEKVAVTDTSQSHNPGFLSTVATDMPNIIVVDRKTTSSQWRIFPEQMLYACPSKPVDTRLNYLHTRGSANKFNQCPEDMMSDIHSVISISKEDKPQLTKYCASEAAKIRMSDFLLPSNLLTTCRLEKIYGFYYLLA